MTDPGSAASAAKHSTNFHHTNPAAYAPNGERALSSNSLIFSTFLVHRASICGRMYIVNWRAIIPRMKIPNKAANIPVCTPNTRLSQPGTNWIKASMKWAGRPSFEKSTMVFSSHLSIELCYNHHFSSLHCGGCFKSESRLDTFGVNDAER